MNSVNLVGRLTKDIELRYTDNQMAICRNTVAINRPTEKGKADFIDIVAFSKTAEAMESYTAKGKLVGVSGRIQTGSYTNQKGDKVYTTDVIVDRIEFLEWKDRQEIQAGFESINEEELPF